MSRREPVMFCEPSGGASAPDVLAHRLEVVADGRVEVRGDRDLDLPAGVVTRVLWLDGPQTKALVGTDSYDGGSLVLLGDGGPLLVTPLVDWSPPSCGSEAVLREICGAVAVARAVGLELEPAEGGDLARLTRAGLRRVLVRSRSARVAPRAAAVPLGVVGVITGLLATTQTDSTLGLALAVVALCTGAIVTVGTAVGRWRARRPVELAGLGQLVGPRPDGQVHRGLLDNVLVLAPREVLLLRQGRLAKVLGPARGGVSRAVFEPALVRLTDGRDRTMATLETSLWCALEADRVALRSELAAIGVAVSDSPFDLPVLTDSGDTMTGKHRPHLLMRTSELGDPVIGASILGWLPCCFAVLGAIGSFEGRPLATVVLVVGLLLLPVVPVLTLERRHGDRRAVQLVTAPRRAPAVSR